MDILKMGGPFGYQPFAVHTHVFVIVADALHVHYLLAVLVANQDYLVIADHRGCITVYLDSLLTVDVVNRFEAREERAEPLGQFLSSFYARYISVVIEMLRYLHAFPYYKSEFLCKFTFRLKLKA